MSLCGSLVTDAIYDAYHVFLGVPHVHIGDVHSDIEQLKDEACRLRNQIEDEADRVLCGLRVEFSVRIGVELFPAVKLPAPPQAPLSSLYRKVYGAVSPTSEVGSGSFGVAELLSPTGLSDDGLPDALMFSANSLALADIAKPHAAHVKPHSCAFRTHMYSWPAEAHHLHLDAATVYRHLDSVVVDEAFSRTLIESDHRWYLRQMRLDMQRGLQRVYRWGLAGSALAVTEQVRSALIKAKEDYDIQLRHLPKVLRETHSARRQQRPADVPGVHAVPVAAQLAPTPPALHRPVSSHQHEVALRTTADVVRVLSARSRVVSVQREQKRRDLWS